MFPSKPPPKPDPYTLSFGKYKGQSVFDIIDHDPEYLDWLFSNVKSMSLDAIATSFVQKVSEKAAVAREVKQIDREHNVSWGNNYYDEYEDDIPF